eukprot:Rmarinus@m.3921
MSLGGPVRDHTQAFEKFRAKGREISYKQAETLAKRLSQLSNGSKSIETSAEFDIFAQTVVLWESDEVKDCSLCGSRFSVVNRRHHCRLCGKIICGVCGYHSVPLPDFVPSSEFVSFLSNYDSSRRRSVRVCSICHRSFKKYEYVLRREESLFSDIAEPPVVRRYRVLALLRNRVDMRYDNFVNIMRPLLDGSGILKEESLPDVIMMNAAVANLQLLTSLRRFETEFRNFVQLQDPTPWVKRIKKNIQSAMIRYTETKIREVKAMQKSVTKRLQTLEGLPDRFEKSRKDTALSTLRRATILIRRLLVENSQLAFVPPEISEMFSQGLQILAVRLKAAAQDSGEDWNALKRHISDAVSGWGGVSGGRSAANYGDDGGQKRSSRMALLRLDFPYALAPQRIQRALVLRQNLQVLRQCEVEIEMDTDDGDALHAVVELREGIEHLLDSLRDNGSVCIKRSSKTWGDWLTSVGSWAGSSISLPRSRINKPVIRDDERPESRISSKEMEDVYTRQLDRRDHRRATFSAGTSVHHGAGQDSANRTPINAEHSGGDQNGPGPRKGSWMFNLW